MAEEKATKKKTHHKAGENAMEKKPKMEHHPATAEKPEEAKELRITLPELKWLNGAAMTTGLAITLLILVAFVAFQSNSLTRNIDKATAAAEEAARLPAVQLTAIKAPCANCTSAEQLVENAKKERLNITSTTVLDESQIEAQHMIDEYGIKSLPAAIITGEISKAGSISGFEKKGNALVFQKPEAPYYDIPSAAAKGLVSITYINDSSCTKCFNIMPFLQEMGMQVEVISLRTVDSKSAEGQRLIDEHQLTRLPATLISKDIMEYEMGSGLKQAGTEKKNGEIELDMLPYVNLSTGKVAGIVDIILLNDTSCSQCYDVSTHKAAVKSYGTYIDNVKVVDVQTQEGKELISKYKITAVPTLMMMGDVTSYPALVNVWAQVGTVEPDGTYVFRQMSAIGGSTFINLTTGKAQKAS